MVTVGKHQADEGWVGPLYSTTDPSCAARLQALLQTRQWSNLDAQPVGGFQPTVYQVLVSSAAVEAHRAAVAAALEEVRRELGEGSEVDTLMARTERK
jgi:hypothetical protein